MTQMGRLVLALLVYSACCIGCKQEIDAWPVPVAGGSPAARQEVLPDVPDGLPAAGGDEASELSVPGTAAGGEGTGPDGGVYVWVPAGEFMMGSEDGEDDERPVHRVRLTKGFWLGKHEVTNAQYRRFCQATGREFPWDSDQGDQHPVVCASWEDAKAYCGHYGLRLPTEAEWEYSARGAAGRRYPWGNEWDGKKCCNDGNRDPGGRTFPVGSFPSGVSWCGASDLAGNVWEWCEDWYAGDYYGQSPASDPSGPQSGDFRMLRGGSWTVSHGYHFRCAYRYSSIPAVRNYYNGFRCARTP